MLARRGDPLEEIEWRVLALLARGRTHRTVARLLSVHPMTLARQNKVTWTKLGAQSSVHAVILALKVDPRLGGFLSESDAPLVAAGPLTAWEYQILVGVAYGYTDAEIAARLGIRMSAVRCGVNRARVGLGILAAAPGGNDRVVLAVAAWESGQLRLEDVLPVGGGGC